MTANLASAGLARLPAEMLGRLGSLRARTDVRVHAEAGWLWVTWPVPDEELARWLLALPGANLFARREQSWYPLDGHLPFFDVPDLQRGKHLSSLLFPSPVTPVEPGPASWEPVGVTLVPDDHPRPATALRLSRSTLAAWADSATSQQLAKLTAATCEDQVLVRGRLPALPGERFWGMRVLIPAGWRPSPALAEDVLVQALRLGAEDVALMEPQGVEVIPGGAFGPVTRAGLRLIAEVARHAR